MSYPRMKHCRHFTCLSQNSFMTGQWIVFRTYVNGSLDVSVTSLLDEDWDKCIEAQHFPKDKLPIDVILAEMTHLIDNVEIFRAW